MMIRTTITIVAVFIASIALVGCQESEGSDAALIQRARLVGNENLKLKQQLEEKDAQIAQLEEKIEQIKAEKEEASRTFGDANIRIMQIVAETENRNEQLVQENEQLKAELETLKSQ